MAFIQTMEFTTDDRDEMLALGKRWTDDAIDTGTAQAATLAEDRSTPGRYVWVVSFDSAEAAAKNSDRPETSKYAEEFGAMCSDGPDFREYDVVAVFGD